MKIPVTGVFSVVLLGRQLGVRKWIGIIMLTVGVAVVQLTKVTNKTGCVPYHTMVVAAVNTTAYGSCLAASFICALIFLHSGLAGAIDGSVGVGDGV